MKPAILWAIGLFLFAQICAWFQSNSGIIGGWMAKNYIYTALVCGPIVALSFAYGNSIKDDSYGEYALKLLPS